MPAYGNRLREANMSDPKQADEFNEIFTQICEQWKLPRDTEEVSMHQAAEILSITISTVVRYAYANPSVLRFGSSACLCASKQPRRQCNCPKTILLDDIVNKIQIKNKKNYKLQ